MRTLIETINVWGGNFLQFAWPMLWQSSLLIALLFVFDFVFRRKIRAAIRHALWLVVLVKLLLPPTLALPTSFAWWVRQTPPAEKPPERAVVVTYGEFVPPSFPMVAALPVFTPPPPPPPKVSAAGWAMISAPTIALGLLAWMLWRWRSVVRTVRNSTEPDESLQALLADAKRTLNLRRKVSLRLTDQPMSPAVCGLFRATILLPRQLAGLPANQLRTVLLHELIHLKRGDIWVNCAQALLQIFYWWHPLLWFANARIRRVREEAVDDAVMLTLRDDAEAYAPTLLEVAKLALRRPLASLGLVGILESRSALRQRIERLVNFTAPRKAGLSVLSLVGVATFAAVAMPMGEPPSTSPLAPSSTNSPVEIGSLTPEGIVQHNEATAITIASNGVKVVYRGETLTADAVHFDNSSGRLDAYGNVQIISAKNRVTANHVVIDTKAGTVTAAENVKVSQVIDNSGVSTSGQLSPIPDPYAANLVATGKGRQNIMAKLDKIRLKEVLYPNSTLGEVVKDLIAKSRDADLQNRGVNILLNPDPIEFDSATNNLSAELPHSIDSVAISIDQPLTDIRLADALNAIVKVAKTPIKYSVEDYAIFFSWRGPEAEPLYIRTFTVDPNTFYTALEHATGTELNLPASVEVVADKTKFVTVTNMSHVSKAVLAYFATLGVKLDSPAAHAAGKSVFWNDRTGQLLVRATKAELDTIEAGLQILNVAPKSKVTFRPIPNPYATNIIPNSAGKGRQAIMEKLEQLRLENVSYTGLPLAEVIDRLSAEVKRIDPKKRGVSILLNPSAPDGLKIGSVSVPEIKSIPITIDPPLTNLRLVDALDAIAKVAKTPIKYNIEDYCVIFSLRGPETPTFYIRSFKLDPEKFYKELAAATDGELSTIRRVATNRTTSGGMQLVTQTNLSAVSVAAHKYFKNLGADLQADGRSVFWSDGSGWMLVRATAQELGIIEAALQKLAADPQLPRSVNDPGNNQAPPKSEGNSRAASVEAAWVKPSATNRVSSAVNERSSGKSTPDTSPATASAADPKLFIRTFTVDPNTFLQGLERAAGTNVSDANVSVALQKFLATFGVDLSPPKSIFWNDRAGSLLVRAPVADLDLIEAAIQALNHVPMQVNVRARFVEITALPGSSGSDFYLGNWPTNSNPGKPVSNNPGNFPGSIPGTSPIATSTQNSGSHAAAATQFTGILTDPQFRVVLRALDQRKDVNWLASPEVTTVSGRQAQVQVVDLRTIVTVNSNALAQPNLAPYGVTNSFYQTQALPFGPTLDVIPHVSPDGYTIQMTITVRMNEFLGYDDPGPLVGTGQQSVTTNVLALPRIRLRQMTTSANVWDGQTLVLGGLMAEDVKRFKDKVPVLGSIPLVGRAFRSESSKTVKKNLIIFVTPTILDPAGNRLHTDEDMPFARESIPPQTSGASRGSTPQK